MKRVRAVFAAIALLCTAPLAAADEEASNIAYVAASQYGNCYARSVPSAGYGTAGETLVYAVNARGGADGEAARYNWFAPQMRLECNVAGADGTIGHSIVQIGPWPRGDAADADTLALAFYWNGERVRRYSTLDIAGAPGNVSASVSHYTVIEEIVGYGWRDSNRYSFVVRTTDGRTLTFDAGTGLLLSTEASPPREEEELVPADPVQGVKR